MITFVTYYVSLSRQTMDTIHQTTKTITVTEPFRFIETMFESARAFHPSCRCAILTDEATRFPFDDTLPVIRFELDDRQPMLSRSEAWPRYLAQAESHVVFLDSDILINADLEHVFAHDFDVALTYRDEKKWPINAGIQFVHESAVEQARAFYQKWLDEYRTRHLKRRRADDRPLSPEEGPSLQRAPQISDAALLADGCGSRLVTTSFSATERLRL
jgi:hypothetical protein